MAAPLASPRYVHSSPWQRIRKAIIAARGGVCELDGEGPRRHPVTGKPDWLDVDHVISRNKGGTNDPSNLRVVHHSEHSRKTAKSDNRWGR